MIVVFTRWGELGLSGPTGRRPADVRTRAPAGRAVDERLEVDCEQLELSLSDEVSGVPRELLERVSERFVRGDRARSQGAGLTGPGRAGPGRRPDGVHRAAAGGSSVARRRAPVTAVRKRCR